MAYLISGQSVTGTGVDVFPALVNWSDMAYTVIESSGNSASASIWGNVSDDNRTWMKITGWAVGVNSTATAQITSFFYKVQAQVDWVSAGTGGNSNTAKVYLQYAPRRMGV